MERAQRSVAQHVLIEIVGYSGAVAGVVATLIAIEQADGLGDVGTLVVALVVTAVLVGAGLTIPGEAVDAYGRMQSVLWLAATFAWAIAVEQFLSEVLEVDPGGDVRPILSAIVTAAGAAILWMRSRRSLQLIALFGALFATLVVLIEASASEFEPADPTVTAIVLWVFGVAWAVAADRGLLQPPRTGLVLGTLAAIAAPFALATPRLDLTQTTITLAAVWSFASAALVLALGGTRGDAAVQGIGVAGVIVGAAVIVGNNVADSDTATIVALVVGLALLGGALLAIRGSFPRARPSSGVPPGPTAPPPAPPTPPLP